eukprot:Pompholyxophrys_punicea_v1_NODE_227_length_2683_cov_13.396650.p1 type:complete len:256 gc:universal NODE_227_length_2683_cov_13.396650:1464-697(-)
MAPTPESLEKRINAVTTRLKEKNCTINKEKSIFRSNKIHFVGRIISASGIAPDNKLTDQIAQCPAPSNHKQLQSFLGLANYFGRFIPHFSEKCTAMQAATRLEPFTWTKQCQTEFEKIKEELTSEPLLQPYSLTKEVTFTPDASEYAIGGVLTQKGAPVVYISKKLSTAESKWPNIEREAYAVVWGNLLLGRHFTINSDHEPLQAIFNPSSELPKHTSSQTCEMGSDLDAIRLQDTIHPGLQHTTCGCHDKTPHT